MRIQLKESSMVKPASATPRTVMAITNLDFLLPSNYHTLAVYFFRFNGDANFFDPKVVKATLGAALVHFYPMAGRLQANGTSIEINCNEEGVLFVEAECDGAVDELDNFSPRADLSFVPKIDYSAGISTFPLFVFQLTRFECGGVCIGMAAEHHVADGASGLHFMISWSELARGLPITTQPFLDRTTVLRGRNPPQPKFSHTEYDPPPTLSTPPLHTQPLVFKNLKLSVKQIHSLKEKAPNCTTYEVIAGHCWHCICKARKLPLNQETKLVVRVDGRPRLKPALPLGYFGNVLFCATPMASVGEIISNPFSYCVDKIHDAIARMDDEYLRSSIDYLELLPDISTAVLSPRNYNCPNIGVVSWVKLPKEKVDFGWGSPVYLGPASFPYEGKCYLLDGLGGNLVLSIALPEDQMDLFHHLFYDI